MANQNIIRINLVNIDMGSFGIGSNKGIEKEILSVTIYPKARLSVISKFHFLKLAGSHPGKISHSGQEKGNNAATIFVGSLQTYSRIYMITVISGSNRGNFTKKIARIYQRMLDEMGVENQLLALDEQPVFHPDGDFRKMEEKWLRSADKFIIVMPEYNGSYPGILKLMMDNSEVSKSWWHKKVALTGVATGRAGNLRGMEHLTGSLLHMKMLVHPNRLPISRVDKLMDEQGELHDLPTLKAIQNQLNEFIKF